MPSQRDAEQNQAVPLAEHKHAIRRHFHRQLKRYWIAIRIIRISSLPTLSGVEILPPRESDQYRRDMFKSC